MTERFGNARLAENHEAQERDAVIDIFHTAIVDIEALVTGHRGRNAQDDVRQNLDTVGDILLAVLVRVTTPVSAGLGLRIGKGGYCQANDDERE